MRENITQDLKIENAGKRSFRLERKRPACNERVARKSRYN